MARPRDAAVAEPIAPSVGQIAPDQADRMIFLTGGAFTTEARQFLSENPKEHLEKPFDPANLRVIVRRYLQLGTITSA